MESAPDIVRRSLTEFGVRVSGSHAQLVCEAGSRLHPRSAELSVPEFAPGEEQYAAARAYARGAAARLLEPANERGDQIDFFGAVSTLHPVLQRPEFADGYEAVAGEPLHIIPAVEGTIAVACIELTAGIRVLPASQVERWGVHSERVLSAAHSILFHRTGYESDEMIGTDNGEFRTWRRGDGADAARILIVDQLDYHAARAGFAVGIPDPDTILIAGLEDAERLRRECIRRFATATDPLTEFVYFVKEAKLGRDAAQI